MNVLHYILCFLLLFGAQQARRLPAQIFQVDGERLKTSGVREHNNNRRVSWTSRLYFLFLSCSVVKRAGQHGPYCAPSVFQMR